MKSILMVCNRSHIDKPLRKSMAHLVKSCHVEIASDGFQAFDILVNQTFDLIVVDFEINGIDGLELVESISYIDPGVPVILMLEQKHKSLHNQARRLNAHPIYFPFKPLSFLRLVDTLLHQHLEQYRDLSGTIQTALEKLAGQLTTKCAFIVEEDGQVLMSAGDAKEQNLASLGKAMVDKLTSGFSNFDFAPPMQLPDPFEKEYNLYATIITEGIYLGVVASPSATTVWVNIDIAVQAIQQALYKNTPLDPTVSIESSGPNKSVCITIPLESSARPVPPSSPDPAQPEIDDVTVNWQIISNNSATLNRLQDILSN